MDKQWELHKEEIVSLYRECTAQEVRDHMRQTHSFNATPQQYERRLKKWGVRKNLKAEEWIAIGRRIAKRKAEDDKESELTVDGYSFPPRKVLKAISRYQEGTIERFQREQRPFRSPTPEGCQLFTPFISAVPSPVISTVPSPGLSAVFSLNLDKAPLLQFQRFMGQKVVFQELLSPLASDKTDYAVVTRPTTEPSQSAQHNPLVLQAVHESYFTLSSSAITQKALGKFFEAVFHTTNHTLNNWGHSGNETFQKLVMDVLERMIETQNKALLLHAISEQNPTFDALIEITFRAALLENRVDLVRFLIESGKVNPNDTIPMYSRPRSPVEIAIFERNFTMAELLLDLGADPCDVVTSDTPVDFWKRVECGELVRKLLEKTVNLKRTQTASIPNTSEDTTNFALSALKAAVLTNDVQIARTIIKLSRHRELEVMDETEDGLVFSAVEAGSMDIVRLLLKSGADVNVPGPLNVSPLTMAILEGKLHIAKLLIDWGASFKRCSSYPWGPTPLQAATLEGFYEIVSILIYRGAEVNEVPSIMSSYPGNVRLSRFNTHLLKMRDNCALEIAVFYGGTNRLKLAQLLVESGADADACLHNILESTTLNLPVKATDEAFKYLLTVSSSFSIGDALYTVINLGFMQSLRVLSERAVNGTEFVSSFNPNRSSAIDCTDPELQVEMVSHLIQHGIELKLSDNRPMRFNGDLYKSNPALAELLLQNGVYVSIFTKLETALIDEDEDAFEDACKNLFSASPHPTLLRDPCFGHSILVLLAELKRSDMVQSLLKWGVRADLPCVVSTVLQICAHGTMENLRMLLSSGAPVNLERDFECDCWNEITAQGGTSIFSPLQVAARDGRTDVVEALLQAGASVNFIGEVYTKPVGYYTPISLVYQHEINSEYTCESTLSISVEGGLETVKLILNAGADVNGPPHGHGGRTALQKAAQVGDIEIVGYLLRERQVDVNVGPAKWRGVTALQAAAINSHFDVAHTLLEMGADPNAPGAEEEGRTALEGAAERGRIDMVQLLLDNGADVTSPDFGAIQLQNAVELARKEGFHAVARMLERHRDSLASHCDGLSL